MKLETIRLAIPGLILMAMTAVTPVIAQSLDEEPLNILEGDTKLDTDKADDGDQSRQDKKNSRCHSTIPARQTTRHDPTHVLKRQRVNVNAAPCHHAGEPHHLRRSEFFADCARMR